MNENKSELLSQDNGSKEASKDKPSVAFIILIVLFPLAGFLYWLFKHKSKPERANLYCTIATIALLVSQVISVFLTISRISTVAGIITSVINFIKGLFGA